MIRLWVEPIGFLEGSDGEKERERMESTVIPEFLARATGKMLLPLTETGKMVESGHGGEGGGCSRAQF